MNDYEQRKQDRIDRLREKASKARAQSDALSRQSWDMISAIPSGQPVMGAADARYRERAGNKMRQSVAASDKADYYERRAQAAENNTAISSDDPEAIAKLESGMEYHPWDKKPFASCTLSNNNRNIRTTEKRIQKLSQAKELGYTGWAFEGGRVEANGDKNRLQIFFDEIPSEEVRTELKGWGFKWARSEGAWQRQLSDNAIYAASRIKAIQPTDGTNPIKIQPKRKNQSGPTR